MTRGSTVRSVVLLARLGCRRLRRACSAITATASTRRARCDEQRPAGAIVVLGRGPVQRHAQSASSRRGSSMRWISIWRASRPGLVVTGGKLPGDRTTEAAVAAPMPSSTACPPTGSSMEDAGRTTLESLEAVAAILREPRHPDAVFVSDGTHMLRVLRMAPRPGHRGLGLANPDQPQRHRPGATAQAMLHELRPGSPRTSVGAGHLIRRLADAQRDPVSRIIFEPGDSAPIAAPPPGSSPLGVAKNPAPILRKTPTRCPAPRGRDCASAPRRVVANSTSVPPPKRGTREAG